MNLNEAIDILNIHEQWKFNTDVLTIDHSLLLEALSVVSNPLYIQTINVRNVQKMIKN
jgi:hypothetical protein